MFKKAYQYAVYYVVSQCAFIIFCNIFLTQNDEYVQYI